MCVVVATRPVGSCVGSTLPVFTNASFTPTPKAQSPSPVFAWCVAIDEDVLAIELDRAALARGVHLIEILPEEARHVAHGQTRVHRGDRSRRAVLERNFVLA